MVACNEMLDPEVQYSLAADMSSWPLAVNVDKLPMEWKEKIKSMERHPSILSGEVLSAHQLPELMASWLVAIEEGWQKNVLEK